MSMQFATTRDRSAQRALPAASRGKGWRITLSLVLGLVAICLLAGSAFANKKLRGQISELNGKIVELRKIDTGDTMGSQLADAEKWLDEALVQLGEEEEGKVKFLLRRAEVQLTFVETKMKQVEAEARAETQRKSLIEAKGRLKELQAKVEELKAAEANMNK